MDSTIDVVHESLDQFARPPHVDGSAVCPHTQYTQIDQSNSNKNAPQASWSCTPPGSANSGGTPPPPPPSPPAGAAGPRRAPRQLLPSLPWRRPPSWPSAAAAAGAGGCCWPPEFRSVPTLLLPLLLLSDPCWLACGPRLMSVCRLSCGIVCVCERTYVCVSVGRGGRAVDRSINSEAKSVRQLSQHP